MKKINQFLGGFRGRAAERSFLILTLGYCSFFFSNVVYCSLVLIVVHCSEHCSDTQLDRIWIQKLVFQSRQMLLNYDQSRFWSNQVKFITKTPDLARFYHQKFPNIARCGLLFNKISYCSAIVVHDSLLLFCCSVRTIRTMFLAQRSAALEIRMHKT